MAASLAGCGSGNQNTAPAGSTAAESKAETETQKTESGEKVKLTFWMEMTTPELDQVYLSIQSLHLDALTYRDRKSVV